MQYTEVMVRYGELSTKGKNRKDFIGRLAGNVTRALQALAMADSQSAVVLAGKGSEKTIKVNGQATPYESDIEIVKAYIAEEKA